MRFLIAPDEAGAFCGRSQGQKLVWEACKSPWCDKFPLGSYEMQSWFRRSRICKHILTARQRLEELLLGEGTPFAPAPWRLVHELLVIARQAHMTGCCSCEPGPMRATSIVLETPAANRCNTASLEDTDYGS